MNFLKAHEFLSIIRDCIGFMGVAIICFGAIRAAYQYVMLLMNRSSSINPIRLLFGDSIILGLEFMMGADIIGSLVAPDYYNVGLLAIIVAIRTVLSFFLTRELDQGITVQKK